MQQGKHHIIDFGGVIICAQILYRRGNSPSMCCWTSRE